MKKSILFIFDDLYERLNTKEGALFLFLLIALGMFFAITDILQDGQPR